MDENVSYWLELCQVDLRAAKVMHRNKLFLYAGFMCHQVAEKALKGYHTHMFKEEAPYTHNLTKLARLTELLEFFPEERRQWLADLENMNVEARYPAKKSALAEQLTEETSRRLIRETEGFFRWIQKKLSSM